MIKLSGDLLKAYNSVDRLELVSSRKRTVQGLQSDRVLAVFMDQNLYIEAVVSSGVTNLNVFRDYGYNNNSIQTIVVDKPIYDMIVSNGDTLVVVTVDGSIYLYKADPSTNLLITTPTKYSSVLTLDHQIRLKISNDGNFVYFSHYQNLVFLDIKAQTFKYFSLDNFITDVTTYSLNNVRYFVINLEGPSHKSLGVYTINSTSNGLTKVSSINIPIEVFPDDDVLQTVNFIEYDSFRNKLIVAIYTGIFYSLDINKDNSFGKFTDLGTVFGQIERILMTSSYIFLMHDMNYISVLNMDLGGNADIITLDSTPTNMLVDDLFLVVYVDKEEINLYKLFEAPSVKLDKSYVEKRFISDSSSKYFLNAHLTLDHGSNKLIKDVTKYNVDVSFRNGNDVASSYFPETHQGLNVYVPLNDIDTIMKEKSFNLGDKGITYTVSNDIFSVTNDSLTEYIAYSWSADGSDRFTTVYPNLNLLTNTSSETRTMIVGNNQTAATFGGVSVYNFSNMTVALSIYLDLTNVQYDVRIQLWSSKGMIVGNFIPAGQKGYSVALGTVPNITSSDASNIALVTRTSVTSDTTITYSKLKLEQGSTATPYMSSASKVKDSDYPSFVGRKQINSTTPLDINNPNWYSWTINKPNNPVTPNNVIGTNTELIKKIFIKDLYCFNGDSSTTDYTNIAYFRLRYLLKNTFSLKITIDNSSILIRNDSSTFTDNFNYVYDYSSDTPTLADKYSWIKFGHLNFSSSKHIKFQLYDNGVLKDTYETDVEMSTKNPLLETSGSIDGDITSIEKNYLMELESNYTDDNRYQQDNRTAYAYSTDGSDRFSIDYPKDNLLDDTVFTNIQQFDIPTYTVKTIPTGGVNNSPYLSIKVGEDNYFSYRDINILNIPNSLSFPDSWKGSVFTFSFYARGTNTLRSHIFPSFIDTSIYGKADNVDIRPNSDGMFDWTLTSQWTKHEYVFTSKTVMTSFMSIIFRVFKGYSVDICLPKFELNGRATPWMPSSTDLFKEGYPKYTGELLDTNSTDPVSSNSYTWSSSKGKEGLVRYPHTAYAYSADGTDRFTTVYPNLNLLTNSRLQSGNITPFVPVNNTVLTINPNVNGLNVSCSGGEISSLQGVSPGLIPVSAGNQYTISVKVINSGTVTIDRFAPQFQFYDSSSGSQFQLKNFSIPADGKVYSLSFTYTAPANARSMRCYFLDIATSVNVAHTFTIYDMKVELGSTVTPWMPAASEIMPGDYPTFIGSYVDNSPTNSLTPSAYTWKFNGDSATTATNNFAYAYSADGTDRFTTVYPNLNLLNFNSGVTFGKFYGWEAGVISPSGYRAYFKKVKVTPNKQYTISANWLNAEWLNVYAFANESDTTAIARYGYSGGVASWDTTFGGGYVITEDTTFTIPANVNYIGISCSSISKDTLTLQALLNGKPKLELGSIVTPWMPSSSEVTTSDYPSYIGKTNDITKSLTDPKSYSWSSTTITSAMTSGTLTVTYATSNDRNNIPSSWSSTKPALLADNILWTRSEWHDRSILVKQTIEKNYIVKDNVLSTDMTSTIKYYLHVAYSNSSDGSKDFSKTAIIDTSVATKYQPTFKGSVKIPVNVTNIDLSKYASYKWKAIDYIDIPKTNKEYLAHMGMVASEAVTTLDKVKVNTKTYIGTELNDQKRSGYLEFFGQYDSYQYKTNSLLSDIYIDGKHLYRKYGRQKDTLEGSVNTYYPMSLIQDFIDDNSYLDALDSHKLPNSEVIMTMRKRDLFETEKVMYKHTIDNTFQDETQILNSGGLPIPVKLPSGISPNQLRVFVRINPENVFRRVNPRFYAIELDTQYGYLRLHLYGEQYTQDKSELMVVSAGSLSGSMFYNKPKTNGYDLDTLPMVSIVDGSILTNLTLDPRDMDVNVNGYTLVPNIDYSIVNITSNNLPTLLVFRNIIPENSMIEINLLDEGTNKVLYFPYPAEGTSNLFSITDDDYQFIPGSFETFVNNLRIPSSKVNILSTKSVQINNIDDLKNVMFRFSYPEHTNLKLIMDSNKYDKMDQTDHNYHSFFRIPQPNNFDLMTSGNRSKSSSKLLLLNEINSDSFVDINPNILNDLDLNIFIDSSPIDNQYITDNIELDMNKTYIESEVGENPDDYTAWAYSADGTDGFTTVYPNLNLLDSTKDFSGTWTNSSSWVTDGTYKDLTVKKRTSKWNGINKIFTAPKDGNYTFSDYVKGSGATTDIIRYGEINGVQQTYKHMYGQFDWLFDSVTVSMKAGQIAFFRYEISTSNVDAILWNAGHKWEEGSTATPWMPSDSEVRQSDYPNYIGKLKKIGLDPNKPESYNWKQYNVINDPQV